MPAAVTLQKPLFSEVRDFILKALNQNDVFVALDQADAELMYSKLVYHEIEGGQLIFEEGFPGTAFYILHTGGVRMDSNKIRVKTLSSEDCFGYIALVHGWARVFTAYSIDRCRFWSLNLEDFNFFLNKAKVNELSEIQYALESHSCLQLLTPKNRASFLRVCIVHHFTAKFKILTEGTLGGLLFFLIRGQVNVLKDGLLLRSLGPGEFFGEQSLLYSGLSTASVITKTDCVCISLDKAHVQLVFAMNLEQFIYRNSIRIAFDSSAYFGILSSQLKEALVKCVNISTYAYDEVVIHEKTRFSEGIWVVLQGSLTIRNRSPASDFNMQIFDCINDDIIVKKDEGCFSHDIVAASDEVAIGELQAEDLTACLGAGFKLRKNPELQLQLNAFLSVSCLKHLSQGKKEFFCRFAEVFCFDSGTELPINLYGNALFILQEGDVELILPDQKTTLSAPCNFGLGSTTPISSAIKVQASTPSVCWILNKAHFKIVFGSYSPEYVRKKLESLEEKSTLSLSDLTVVTQLLKARIGSIFLVTDRDGKKYALKRVCRQQVKSLFLFRKLLSEREVLEEVSHPLIVKLVRHFKDSQYVYFLTEFISGEVLSNLIPRINNPAEREVKLCAGMIISILAHLHGLNVIHRDINPESFLVDKAGFLHLVDVGSALIVPSRTNSLIGCPHYMAPEIVQNKPYGKEVDLWSAGILIFEMIYGRVPYGDMEEDPYLVFKEIDGGEQIQIKDGRLSPDCISFLTQLLARDPAIRGSVQEAKTHCWLQDFNFVSSI